MQTWKKIILGTGVGTAVVAGTTWLLRLNNSSAKLETIPTIQLHKLTLQGLFIRVNIQLKNPTRTVFKIKYPFIKLSYKDTAVGSSQVVNQDIILPAFGEAYISDILIQIPILNIFSSAGKLISALQNNETVKLDVITLTTIDIGIKKVPYTKTDSLTLKK
jgi:hypothetical protein